MCQSPNFHLQEEDIFCWRGAFTYYIYWLFKELFKQLTNFNELLFTVSRILNKMIPTWFFTTTASYMVQTFTVMCLNSASSMATILFAVVNAIYFIYSPIFETLSLILRNAWKIFRSMFGFIRNLNKEILKHLFKIFYVVIIMILN